MIESNEMVKNQWNRVCSRIQKAESGRFAVRWLSKLVPDKIEGRTVSLIVPSPCIHELVKQNYASQILSYWQEENEDIVGLDLKLAPQVQPELPLVMPEVTVKTEPMTRLAKIEPEPLETELPKSLLNPNYTFEKFVVGSANQFAYAAARKIAEDDSVSFNPLYVHGGSGLGKTHLMHAIAWRMRELHPERNVLYLSSEQFFLSFMKALRSNGRTSFESTERLREIFRSVDVLMVDDIQFICGKDKTQEEFFNTFNYLIAHGKKIILSADSSPHDLYDVENKLAKRADMLKIADRIRTRIAQGLVVDVLPPSYELRLGILEEKVKEYNTKVPAEILDYLAKNITSNVRELEGALKRVIAHAELMGEEMTIASTQRVLKDVLRVTEKEITIKEIQYAVCGHYQIGLSDLKSVRRERKIARPRQLAMYLAKVLTPRSLPDIGNAFEKDHTTVMHAVKTIENLIGRDQKLAQDTDTLIRRLRGEAI